MRRQTVKTLLRTKYLVERQQPMSINVMMLRNRLFKSLYRTRQLLRWIGISKKEMGFSAETSHALVKMHWLEKIQRKDLDLPSIQTEICGARIFLRNKSWSR
ncbi:hypothetical protein QG37_07074 [Candidozyma auris]|nr:hypothetical protein QG37_07074 [[Candida] auris]